MNFHFKPALSFMFPTYTPPTCIYTCLSELRSDRILILPIVSNDTSEKRFDIQYRYEDIRILLKNTQVFMDTYSKAIHNSIFPQYINIQSIYVPLDPRMVEGFHTLITTILQYFNNAYSQIYINKNPIAVSNLCQLQHIISETHSRHWIPIRGYHYMNLAFGMQLLTTIDQLHIEFFITSIEVNTCITPYKDIYPSYGDITIMCSI